MQTKSYLAALLLAALSVNASIVARQDGGDAGSSTSVSSAAPGAGSDSPSGTAGGDSSDTGATGTGAGADTTDSGAGAGATDTGGTPPTPASTKTSIGSDPSATSPNGGNGADSTGAAPPDSSSSQPSGAAFKLAPFSFSTSVLTGVAGVVGSGLLGAAITL